MKDFITMLSTAVVMFIGITCFAYYLLSEITYGSVIVGFIGFILVLSPSWDKWKQIFNELYWGKEKNN
jgi:hypothetical protein